MTNIETLKVYIKSYTIIKTAPDKENHFSETEIRCVLTLERAKRQNKRLNSCTRQRSVNSMFISIIFRGYHYANCNCVPLLGTTKLYRAFKSNQFISESNFRPVGSQHSLFLWIHFKKYIYFLRDTKAGSYLTMAIQKGKRCQRFGYLVMFVVN